jgi:hypothetical protein
MTPRIPERRSSQRHALKIPLSLRTWGAAGPVHRAESIDLSARGVLLETEAELRIGALIELRLKLPEEITGQPTMEWRCKSRVIRSACKDLPDGRSRVGLHFDWLGVPR